MAHRTRFSLLAIAACAVWVAAVPAGAQVTTGQTIKAKPVRTREVKPAKTRFEVLHMMTTGIQVRSLENGLEIHTFIYSDQIRDAMLNLFDQGGYQYGDIIEIQYQLGTDVALKIKGKPSKPL